MSDEKTTAEPSGASGGSIACDASAKWSHTEYNWRAQWDRLGDDDRKLLARRVVAVPKWAGPSRPEWVRLLAYLPVVWKQYLITRESGVSRWWSAFWAKKWADVLLGFDQQ